MTGPRIGALEPPYSPALAAAFDAIMPRGVPPLLLFRTLAVNERVLLRLFAGNLLDRGSISLREREIVIDRTCARCGSEYEWGVHVALFRERAGLTDEQVAATCSADRDSGAFTKRERLLLRLVDELHDSNEISDPLWLELRVAWNEAQLVELLALVGFYHLIAWLANALRIPNESYAPRFPASSAASGRNRRAGKSVKSQAG